MQFFLGESNLFIVFLFGVHFCIQSVQSGAVTDCEGANILLLEDQVVQLKDNTVNACINTSEVNTPFIFESMLTNATTLDIKNVMWPPFPELSLLVKVNMENVTPRREFGGCSKLEEMLLYDIDTTLIPPNWLANCKRLRKVHFVGAKVSQVHTVLNTTFRVKEVIIAYLQETFTIVDTPLFSNTSNKHRWIESVELSSITDFYDNRASSNTTSSEIMTSLLWQLSVLPQLKYLTVSGEAIDFCTITIPVTLRSLQILSLTYTSTSHLCFRDLIKMPQLTNLKIEYNKIDDLQFDQVFSNFPQNMTMDFAQSEPVAKLHFTRDDYLALLEGTRKINFYFIRGIEIQCNFGEGFWLTRALQTGFLEFPSDLKCSDGEEIITSMNGKCERLACDGAYSCGPCVCCLDKHRDGFIADCRGADVTALPTELLHFDNLTELRAPNNSIRTLPNYLPYELLLLDLSGNNISRLSPEAVSAIFATSLRRIRLAGNPIECSCENLPMIRALQEHKAQIENHETLVCKEDHADIFRKNVSTLCDLHNLKMTLKRQQVITAGVGVVLLALTAVFYFRNRLQIFFFTRGWCLCCVQNRAVDDERRFDIFLSFCHEDQDIVLNQILPYLKKDYSVCVHLWDWYPGEMIPTQILMSVKQSKRTMVILSKNFLRSSWGMTEFQTAYASSLEERRVRVVMVVLDNVLEESQVEGDLGAYIRLNTYLQWGDPEFWKKLWNALPRRTTPFAINK